MYQKITDFPHDFFVPLVGDPHHLGRLTLNLLGDKKSASFTVEIDIVEKDSKKIFYHVDILYGLSEKDEAVHCALQRLSDFLKLRCQNL